MTLKKRTAVFGFGAMGSALVKGWIESGMMPPAAITAVEVDDDKRKAAVRKLGIKATVNPKEALKGAGLALLAVKPQQMKELLEKEGQHFSPGVLVVSIAAGVSTRQIEKGLPQGNPVVRVMPNTPALLGAGMAAVAAGSRAKEAHVKLVLKLFSAVGKSVRVNEAQMDLVTGLSGSGPAETHRHTGLYHSCESRDDDATPAAYACVPALPVSLCAPAGQPKSFLNNRSASCNPSSVSTTDFALPTGSEM